MVDVHYFRDKYRIASNRIPRWNYSVGWYFITICTQDRVWYFGDVVDGKMVLNEMGKIVRDEIVNTVSIKKNVMIDAFVVMPNHVHMILFCNYENNCIDSNNRIDQNNRRDNSGIALTG